MNNPEHRIWPDGACVRFTAEAKTAMEKRPGTTKALRTPGRGPWMQTYSGGQFFPLQPRPEDVHPVDIAHALSMLCRYNGHVREFMSVAEHCVLLSHAVPADNALWALLHDATEAYVGDMVRPLKRQMHDYRAVEDGVMVAIAARFGIDPVMPEEVHLADARILLDERAVLMTPPPADWGLGHLEPLGVEIQAWSPTQANRHYTNRLNELLGDDLK